MLWWADGEDRPDKSSAYILCHHKVTSSSWPLTVILEGQDPAMAMRGPKASLSVVFHVEIEGNRTVRGLSPALFCIAASQNGLRGSPSPWHC